MTVTIFPCGPFNVTMEFGLSIDSTVAVVVTRSIEVAGWPGTAVLSISLEDIIGCSPGFAICTATDW